MFKFCLFALCIFATTAFAGEGWEWNNPSALPKSGNWYMANGSIGKCMPISINVVQATERLWRDKGNPVTRKISESGNPSLIIFQGGDKILMLYASASDCQLWLPAAIRMER